MKIGVHGSLALGLALAMGSAHPGTLVAPLPYNDYLVFEAGQVCDFPIEFSAGGELQEFVTKEGRFISLAPGVANTITNLLDPAKTYSSRAGGELNVYAIASADTLIETRGQVYYFSEESASNPGAKGLWLLDGAWQSAIDELGDPARPLTGNGRRIDLCRLLR
jgi:hypothetical protein